MLVPLVCRGFTRPLSQSHAGVTQRPPMHGACAVRPLRLERLLHVLTFDTSYTASTAHTALERVRCVRLPRQPQVLRRYADCRLNTAVQVGVGSWVECGFRDATYIYSLHAWLGYLERAQAIMYFTHYSHTVLCWRFYIPYISYLIKKSGVTVSMSCAYLGSIYSCTNYIHMNDEKRSI